MIKPSDVLVLVGGLPLQRFGTLVRATTSPGRNGEDLALAVTRATTGWARSRSGILMPFAANVPRVHWVDLDGDGDPETATLLIERAATNLLLHSADISNAAWTKTNATVNADAATAPDGTAAADEIVENSSAGVAHGVEQTVTIGGAGNTITHSTYAAANTRTILRMVCANGAGTELFQAWFDLAAGVVGTTSATGSSTFIRADIEPDGDGYICAITGVVSGATSIRCLRFLATADNQTTYNGDGASGLYVWGGQLNDGAVAPSIIVPTTTATVTRASDLPTMSYFGPLTDVTVFAKFVELGTIHGTAGSYRILQIGSTPDFRLLNRNNQDYSAEYTPDGATSVVSVVATPNPTLHQVVELLAPVTGAGLVQLDQALDGGTVSSGGQSSAPASLPAKDTSAIYVGHNGTGSGVGQLGLIAAGVLRGTGHTIQDLRRLLAA